MVSSCDYCPLKVSILCPQAYEEKELLRLVYFGGVDASLRKEVWPFLLGHYQFGMSDAERNKVCHFHSCGFAPIAAFLLNDWLLIPPSPGGWTGASVLPADHVRVAPLRGDRPPAGEGAARCGVSKVLLRSEHGQLKSEDDAPRLHRQQWGEAVTHQQISLWWCQFCHLHQIKTPYVCGSLC